MANYQQYQRYRRQSENRSMKYGKLLIILGIIVVLYLIGRSIFGSNDSTSTIASGNNDNSTVSVNGAANANINMNDDVNANTNVNSNSNTNSNTNTATNTNTAIAGTFSVSKCTATYSRGKTSEKKIALTFNIGTDKEGQLQTVLDALKNAQVPADFFARGDKVESNSALVTKINTAGFPVYNLSYSYVHFNDLPETGVTEQLTKANTAISKITDKTTKPFFRPPYGDTLDADILTAVKDAGYCPVTWTIDAMDWSTEYTAAQSKERVLSKAANGAIILMQASNATTAEIVPDIITQLKGQGYSFVHLEDLL